MPFTPPIVDKCPACDKSVYPNEAKLAAGVKWHPMCFKCGSCAKMLDSTTVCGHEGRIYCKQCHGKHYGPKGYGFGGGGGGLGTEGAEGSAMKDKMASTTIKGPVVEGGCPRCGKRVYDAEKKVGAGKDWHKSCFNCKNCHKTLDSSKLNEAEGEIYCKQCYAKNFGPIGKV